MTEIDEFEPTGWWRLLDSAGNIKCESSDRKEIRAFWEAGDKIQRLYEKTQAEWRDEVVRARALPTSK